MYFFRSRDFEIQNQLTRKSKAGTIPKANKAPIILYFRIIRTENVKPKKLPTIFIKINFLNSEKPFIMDIRKRLRAKSGSDNAITLKTIPNSYSSPKILLFQYSEKTKTGIAKNNEILRRDQKIVEIIFVSSCSFLLF